MSFVEVILGLQEHLATGWKTVLEDEDVIKKAEELIISDGKEKDSEVFAISSQSGFLAPEGEKGYYFWPSFLVHKTDYDNRSVPGDFFYHATRDGRVKRAGCFSSEGSIVLF